MGDSGLLGLHEKILLYGPPGTGKTEVSATAPPPVYHLIIGPRNELKTLESPGFKKRHPGNENYYDYVQETRGSRGRFDTPEAFDKACDMLDATLKMREAGDFWFESLVIENASTLLGVQLNKALVSGSLGSLGGVNNPAFKKYIDENIVQPADNDWGLAQSLMEQFVTWVYNLPMHVVMVAHEKDKVKVDRKTRTETIVSMEPNFIGQQRKTIPALFDNVWRTSVDGSGRSAIYNVHTVGSEEAIGKTRVGGVLREKEVNLNIAQAIRRMKEAA